MSLCGVAFAIPGDLMTPTGGYSYDRHLFAGLRAQGREVTHVPLGASYPDPTPDDAEDAASRLARLPADCPVIIDGLALGALDPAAVAAISAPMIALVHHPLASEGNLDAGRREYLMQTERTNLGRAAHVVVTSPYTADLLIRDYGVPTSRITIARPGTNREVGRAERVDPPLILSVGIQVPRKGHDVLLEALAKIAHLAWQAVIVGSVIDEPYADGLVRIRDDRGLGDRVHLAGHVPDDELARLYSNASIFALATRFEGYGMVFGEAMAHGLPIVSCRTGAVSDTVADGAGVLVDPDDSDQFASALARVLEEPGFRDALAGASARAGALLDDWADTAAEVGAVVDGVHQARGDGSVTGGRAHNDD